MPAGRAARRGAAAALVMTAVMYLTANFSSQTVPVHAVVFLAASLAIMAAGRVSDRLWDGMVAPALRYTSPQFCLVSRLPFRFLAGGIAFTTILLISKKLELVPVRDIPVLDLFMTGGILSVCYYGFIEGFRGFRHRASGNTTGRGGRTDGDTHDEDRTT